METKEDLNASIEMFLNQILGLVDLMLDQDNITTPNLLTIRSITELCLKDFIKIQKLI